jgi:O-antigen ligase
MQKLVQDRKEVFFFLAFLPFLLTPFVAVEIPRAITYLPIFSVFFAFFAQQQNFKSNILDFRNYIVFITVTILFLWAHTYFIAQYDKAYERLGKLSLLMTIGSLFLVLLSGTKSLNFKKYLNIFYILSAIASLLLSFEIKFDAPLYNYLRGGVEQSEYIAAVFNRSSVILILLGFASFFLIENKRKYHFSLLAAFVPVVFLTYSQSAQLVFVFILICYFLMPFSQKWFWWTISAAIAVFILSKPFIVPYLFNDMPSFVNQIDILRQACAGQRMEIWDYVSRKVYDHLVLGHGLEFTQTYKNFDTQKIFHERTQVMHPHSFALQIWIEFGLAGILLTLFAICSLIKIIYQKLRGNIQKTAITILLSYLLVSSVSHGMWQSWWVALGFMLGALIVMAHRHQKIEQNEAN